MRRCAKRHGSGKKRPEIKGELDKGNVLAPGFKHWEENFKSWRTKPIELSEEKYQERRRALNLQPRRKKV